MYQEQAFHLSTSRIAALRRLTDRLDIRPGPGGSRCSEYIATRRVYEPELRDLFPPPWTQAMIVALYPSSQIVSHRDPAITGTRYHLPLQTNEHCWVFHDGVWVQLAEGRCYAMDPSDLHGAVNWGDTLRLHLAIDVVLH